MSLQTKIEDMVGSQSDTTALTDWLQAGAKYITNILPEQRVEKYTSDLTDAGSGQSVLLHKVFGAHKSGYGARRVSANLAAQVASSSSIHYAGTTDPVWYILNGTAYVKPGGGTIRAMAYPLPTYTDLVIAGFPLDLEYGVILYAAIQARLRQLSDLAITISELSFTEQVVPTAPASPSFTYDDVSYSDAVYSDALYGDVSYNDAEYTSASYNAASYLEALIDTIAATTVTFTDTISYTPPTFDGAYTNTDTALTNEDIELANAHLNKVQAQLEEMQKELLVSLNEFNSDKAQFDIDFQQAVTDAQLTQQRLIEQTRIQIELNKFNAQQALQEGLQNASQESQIDLANRRAALELSMVNKGKELETAITNATQQAQIDLANRRAELELSITNKSKALETDIINESKGLEKQIQEYQAKLQLYGQEMNGYSVEVNQEVSKMSSKLSQYGSQSQIMLAGLQALRNEFNEFIKVI